MNRRRPRTAFGRYLRELFSLGGLACIAFGALIGVVLVLLSTPDARADDNTDNAFLSVLSAEGFSYDHANTGKVINNGRQVCELLAAGTAPFDIVSGLDRAEPSLNRPGASLFAALANAVYCPQFGAEVGRA